MAAMTSMTEGTVAFRDGETWYTVSQPADPVPGRLPLIALHGGPGMTHDYLRSLPDLFDDRPVILYDQFGTGNSSRRPDWDAQEWTAGFFVDQLRELVAHLGFAEAGGFHLLGHSWGGMLAQEYVLSRPSGLASLILSDTSASAAGITQSMAPLLAAISAEEPDEQTRRNLFFERHFCRVTPMPEDLVRTFELVGGNPTVYLAMMGASEGEVTGTLQDWNAVPRLPEIEVPTLVLAGEYDELQPVAWSPLAELIPGARAHVFTGASHMPFVEFPQEYHAVVAPFLAEHDGVLG
jgi:L-proline amide hydrolase